MCPLDTNKVAKETKVGTSNLEKTLIQGSILKLMQSDVFKDSKTRKFLEWLSPGPFYTRHIDIRKDLGEAVKLEEIGKWFLGSQKFQEWAKGGEHNHLCCYGLRTPLIFLPRLTVLAGAGKSVMTLEPF